MIDKDSTPEPAHRTGRTALASCCGTHALQDGLTSSIYVLLPVLAQTFGLGYAQVGFIRAVYSGAMSLMELPSGLLSERIGERALLTFGLCGAGVGYLLVSFASGFDMVLLAFFVAGFGAAFQHALSSSLISRSFEIGQRRVALGTYNASGDIGKLTATGIVSLLLGVGVGWQGVTGGLGVVALLAAGVLYVALRSAGLGMRPPVDTEKPVGRIRLLEGVRDRRGFATLMAIVFIDIAVQDGVLVFIAFLMIEKNVPTGLAALAIVLTLAGGVVGKFGGGLLTACLGVVRALLIAECLTAVALLAVLAAPTLLAYCLLPVLGVVLQGSSTITYGTVSDLVDPHRQARAFAVVYSFSAIASVTAPIAFGLLATVVGLTSTFLTMAAIVLLPIPLCLLLRPALSRAQTA